jgi:nitrogen regulatory protein P-II 1
MMKIEAVIHPFKLNEIKAALEGLDCERLTISDVFLIAGRDAPKSHYRGCEYSRDVPKTKLEMLVSAGCVDEVINVLSRTACAGAGDDEGSIVVYEVSDAIRIRGGRRFAFSLS